MPPYQATITCTVCGQEKERSAFSANQIRTAKRCSECTEANIQASLTQSCPSTKIEEKNANSAIFTCLKVHMERTNGKDLRRYVQPAQIQMWNKRTKELSVSHQGHETKNASTVAPIFSIVRRPLSVAVTANTSLTFRSTSRRLGVLC